jgi:ABC-2 type transport system permease protein
MGARLKQLLIKEFIQIFRDPRTRGVVFIMPIFQMMIFGYAVTTDVKHVATGIYDLDNSVASRELLSRFIHSGYFDVEVIVTQESQIQPLIDHGRVQALIRMNQGFEKDLKAGKTGLVQMIVDGTDSNSAAIILNYSGVIVTRYSQDILIQRFLRMYGSTQPLNPVELESRAWFNENLESRNFYVPGVIALLVMLITLLLTSMAVVREKEIGTIEQIMVTPITPKEFILGKTLPFALISLIDVVLITLVGVYWFEVPIRGSLGLLLLATSLYLMTTLGMGLFISTISRTQQQAMMSAFFFQFPATLLSGFVFPIANMPEVVQWLTYLNPLRYFLVIIRGIFLKGVGLPILWPHMAVLAVMGLLTLWLASKRFKKTMV